jgi:hypothetical protein
VQHFLGSPTLRIDGEDVEPDAGKREDFGATSLPEGVEMMRGDLSDPNGLAERLDGIEAVFLLWPFHRGSPYRDRPNELAGSLLNGRLRNPRCRVGCPCRWGRRNR